MTIESQHPLDDKGYDPDNATLQNSGEFYGNGDDRPSDATDDGTNPYPERQTLSDEDRSLAVAGLRQARKALYSGVTPDIKPNNRRAKPRGAIGEVVDVVSVNDKEPSITQRADRLRAALIPFVLVGQEYPILAEDQRLSVSHIHPFGRQINPTDFMRDIQRKMTMDFYKANERADEEGDTRPYPSQKVIDKKAKSASTQALEGRRRRFRNLAKTADEDVVATDKVIERIESGGLRPTREHFHAVIGATQRIIAALGEAGIFDKEQVVSANEVLQATMELSPEEADEQLGLWAYVANGYSQASRSFFTSGAQAVWDYQEKNGLSRTIKSSPKKTGKKPQVTGQQAIKV